ncbi:MAG: Gfo/Idh/MocA family oxidoreductase [Oscillospiraceae bacterium]|nr:Gfo/Idh/MocA family oxidoreductase [Oscillospiraceae bacterium]
MINVAIIGTGGISPTHFRAYAQLSERCKIVALCDIVPEKCEKMKQEFSLPDAVVFDNHKAMLESGIKIDLADICTPPFCHAEITIDCLNAGMNVVVEKPMAASLDECDKMIEAAQKSGKKLSVIAQNRFRDPIWNLKKVLDSGIVGKIVHAQVDSHWWRGHSYYDLWWRGLWTMEGGGCTLNHAVHHIDMLGWMMGLPQELCAILTNVSHDNAEVEDLSVAVLKYKNGALAQITSSVVNHGEEQQIIYQGERARISAPWRVTSQKPMPNGHPVPNPEFEKEVDDYYNSLSSLKYDAHTGQLDDVLFAIENDTEPFIGGADGRLTIELVTAIYKAGSEKKTVKLPIDKNDAFYTVEGIRKNVPYFYEKKTSVQDIAGEITHGSSYKY